MTESTTIIKGGDKYMVAARGGYDGYLKRSFDTIEEALAFVTHLWIKE